MGHLAKPRDASFFRVFFNPYHYGVLTIQPSQACLVATKMTVYFLVDGHFCRCIARIRSYTAFFATSFGNVNANSKPIRPMPANTAKVTAKPPA